MAHTQPNPSTPLGGRSAARQVRSMGEGAREAVLPLEGISQTLETN